MLLKGSSESLQVKQETDGGGECASLWDRHYGITLFSLLFIKIHLNRQVEKYLLKNTLYNLLCRQTVIALFMPM